MLNKYLLNEAMSTGGHEKYSIIQGSSHFCFVFFFVKDRIIDILGFGTILSVVIAQLCQVAQKQPQTNEQGVF